MDTTSTFLFEVLLKDTCRTRGANSDSPASDRSVIVEMLVRCVSLAVRLQCFQRRSCRLLQWRGVFLY